MDLAPVERSVAKQMFRDGRNVPDSMTNAPELRIGLQFYIEAFFDLDSERSHGESLSPIPWGKIKDYAQAYECDEEQTADLIYLVKQMDADHLKRLAAKMKAKTKHGGKPANTRKAHVSRRR